MPLNSLPLKSHTHNTPHKENGFPKSPQCKVILPLNIRYFPQIINVTVTGKLRLKCQGPKIKFWFQAIEQNLFRDSIFKTH